MKKFQDMSPQHKTIILRIGMRKCPVAGCNGKRSPRSPVRGYCERHVEMRAEAERRRIGAKKRHTPKSVWAQIDWTLGAKLVAAMTGVTLRTAQKKYKVFFAMGKIKAVPGFINKRGERRKPPQ
jgi:hypothetical protein